MTSVLDEMTARVMSGKQEKAAQLTPVGREPGGPLAVTPTGIPADLPGAFMAAEGLADVAKDLRRQAEFLIQVADGIDAHIGRQAEAVPDKAAAQAAQKAAEVEADRRAAERVTTPETEAIKERLAAISKDAQAKTFVAADADDDEGEPVPLSRTVEGWVCPTHGDDALKDLTSRKGRKYRACSKCEEFEK